MKSLTLKKILAIFLWITMAYYLNNQGLITLDNESLIKFITRSPNYTRLLFIFLSSARIFVFIPGVVFMIIGGILFGPFEGFALSMLSMIIGQTAIYFLSKIFNFNFIRQKLLAQHHYIEPLIREYDYKFLALGVITPIAPTDIVCFLSCMCGIGYKKYIATIAITNIPMMLIFSSIGDSFESSIFSSILLILSIALCTFVTIELWYRLKNENTTEDIIDQT